MADENGALNNEAGSSPVPAQIGELVSTVEFHTPKPSEAAKPSEGTLKSEPTEKTATTGKEPEGGKTEADGKEAKPPAENDRFDKHPRFQELNRRVKESDDRIRKLEQELASANKSRSPGKDGAEDGSQKPPFRDISKMKPEELLDWQSENPHEYYQNVLAQAKHEISQDVTQSFEQRQKEDAVVSTFENFAKQNPDFDEMWDSGTLQEFIRNNPGHNAISSYFALTADAKLKAATEKAAKDAEAQFVKNQRAKRVSDVLPQGPSAPGSTGSDDMLKDTRKFGGSTAVLAQRLSERRRAQAGM